MNKNNNSRTSRLLIIIVDQNKSNYNITGRKFGLFKVAIYEVIVLALGLLRRHILYLYIIQNA